MGVVASTNDRRDVALAKLLVTHSIKESMSDHERNCGPGGCFRVDETYLRLLKAMMLTLEDTNLQCALNRMRVHVVKYMTKYRPEEALFQTDDGAKAKLDSFALEDCAGSFRACYSAERIPVYDIVSTLYHSQARVDKSGALSKAVRDCAEFYKGLETELKSDRAHYVTSMTVYRGVSYHFIDLTEYYAVGTELAMYEPKSWSRSRAKALQFATSSGTLYEMQLMLGHDIHHVSFLPDEWEVVVALGTRFRVIDRIVDHSGPNIVRLQQI